MSAKTLRPVNTYGAVDGRSQAPAVVRNTAERLTTAKPAKVIGGGIEGSPRLGNDTNETLPPSGISSPWPPPTSQPLPASSPFSVSISTPRPAPVAVPPQPTLPSTQFATRVYEGSLPPANDYSKVGVQEDQTLAEKFAPFACEFLGTFMLTFTVGSCSVTGSSLWNATAIAFVLMVLVYSMAPVSGGHLNPAVSLTLWLLGKVSLPKMIGYWIAQFAAGGLAGLLVLGIFSKSVDVGPVHPYDLAAACSCEVGYTAMLCFVVANCAASVKTNPKGDSNHFYALAIGFVIIAGGYASGTISGAMFNPAVACGLDLAHLPLHFPFIFSHAPIYVAVEAIGAVIAAMLFLIVRPEEGRMSSTGTFNNDFKASLLPRVVSELLGTLVLTTTVGLNVITKSRATAWSAGAALMSMVYSLGDVSGGHFNPAVTLAIVLSGRGICKGRDFPVYVFTQFVAGTISGFMLRYIHAGGNNADEVFGLAPGAGYTWLQTGVAEVVFTFLLAWIVLSVATVKAAYPGKAIPAKKNFHFAFAIGACVTIAGFAVGAVSGASINPAVSVAMSVEMSPLFLVQSVNSNVTSDSFLAIHGHSANATAVTVVLKPQSTFFGTYCLFEFAGGMLAALMFHCTHAHEYYSKNHLP